MCKTPEKSSASGVARTPFDPVWTVFKQTSACFLRTQSIRSATQAGKRLVTVELVDFHERSCHDGGPCRFCCLTSSLDGLGFNARCSQTF